MNMDRIFSTRDFDAACILYQQMAQFADKRATFIAAITIDQLDPAQISAIERSNETIAENLAFANLYLAHLADMEALGMTIPLAA